MPLHGLSAGCDPFHAALTEGFHCGGVSHNQSGKWCVVCVGVWTAMLIRGVRQMPSLVGSLRHDIEGLHSVVYV